ncbi:hypothetical protein ACWGQ4_26790, partial [Streptomyces sp. NPDC055721]
MPLKSAGFAAGAVGGFALGVPLVPAVSPVPVVAEVVGPPVPLGLSFSEAFVCSLSFRNVYAVTPPTAPKATTAANATSSPFLAELRGAPGGMDIGSPGAPGCGYYD